MREPSLVEDLILRYKREEGTIFSATVDLQGIHVSLSALKRKTKRRIPCQWAREPRERDADLLARFLQNCPPIQRSRRMAR